MPETESRLPSIIVSVTAAAVHKPLEPTIATAECQSIRITSLCTHKKISSFWQGSHLIDLRLGMAVNAQILLPFLTVNIVAWSSSIAAIQGNEQLNKRCECKACTAPRRALMRYMGAANEPAMM